MTDGDGLDWVRDAIFYEIFPDRFANGDRSNDPPNSSTWGDAPTRENFFGGDLAGILAKLPYLADLGVTGLYLTPIFLAGTNHRYDTHDYLTVDPVLGAEPDLRELVTAAHARGIRVLLDGVFNHVGDGFWAFRDVVERGPSSPYRDWFDVRAFPIATDPLNYQTCGGTAYLPKLNTANPAVRDYIIEVARAWIERADIDGWRLDVPWKAAPELWRDFRPAVKAAKGSAYLVGEIWHSWDGWFDAFDGLMNYQLRSRLLDFCVLDSMDAEDLALETGALLARMADPTLMLNLLGSHDTERLMTIAGGDVSRVILAMTALFTFPGVPMLYYGDEVGLEGANDPDCRRTMPWDGGGGHEALRDAVRELARFRKDHSALRRGSWEVVATYNRVLVFARRHGADAVLIILNAGAAQGVLEIGIAAPLEGDWQSPEGMVAQGRDGSMVVPGIAARSALILVREAVPVVS